MIYSIRTDRGVSYEAKLSILSTYATIRGYSLLTCTFTVESNLDLTTLINIEWIFSVNIFTSSLNTPIKRERNKSEEIPQSSTNRGMC